MIQGDLYPATLYGGTPGHAKTDTSRAAAESVVESSKVWRQRVLNLIVSRGGLTADEVRAILRCAHNTTSPRITELKLLGLIEDRGRRRATEAGRQAIVWEAK